MTNIVKPQRFSKLFRKLLPQMPSCARFHNERGIKNSLFLLLIISRLKSKQALSEAKKFNKTENNTPFHARKLENEQT